MRRKVSFLWSRDRKGADGFGVGAKLRKKEGGRERKKESGRVCEERRRGDQEQGKEESESEEEKAEQRPLVK